MFDEHNALAKISRFVRDRLDAGVVQNVKIRLFANRSGQGREYDLPSANELAELERITFYHPSLMALQYPILFPYGEADWHANIMVRNAGQTRNTISQCDYYSYCLQTRLQNRSTLLVAGRLFQQYVVNAYALVEAERLDWIRNNQRKLHSHYFHGLTGKHIILASSHTGSPRYKYENFQDAVAICRTLGFPGLFITFTCNTEVLARVFKLKLNRSMSEIKTKEIFGRCIASEIPDIKEDPWCYDLVTKFMFHGPCGALNSNAPCTIDRKCNKHFPKAFCICTAIDVDGFPRYRRSDNGRSVTKNGAELDNQYVVPYNRYLLLRFDAHINVEFCNKSRAIKYLFKYINKPPDRAMATIVQTENSYSIDSTTDKWMKLNAYYPGARQYTFVEFPQHFVWNREAKAWKPRKNKQCIGSLYYCHPSSQEVFYLRMLLHTVKGCTSFEDIRTVNGKTYDSFKQTCNAHGFLTDDGEWNHCLEEVSFTATAREMRKLFVTKLLYCQVSDVKSLWEKNWTLLSDDILFSRRQELRLPNLELSIEETKILCLLQLQNILRGFGKTLADIQGLPAPPVDSTLHLSNSLLAEEMNYDCAALQAQFQSNFMKLNTEQKAAYNQIMESVETNGHQLFFIDGYGGTGKTFLWQVISMKLRADKKVVYV
ncbi:hypothetical protein LINPERHAP2_LOCUS4846 [Linum perenne]